MLKNKTMKFKKFDKIDKIKIWPGDKIYVRMKESAQNGRKSGKYLTLLIYNWLKLTKKQIDIQRFWK